MKIVGLTQRFSVTDNKEVGSKARPLHQKSGRALPEQLFAKSQLSDLIARSG